MFSSLPTLQDSHNFRALSKITVNSVFHHTYTLWLFTSNDLKTMMFPSTAFAIFNGIAVNQAGSNSVFTSGLMLFLIRTPIVLLWVWINLLAFAVNNQRQASALEEDRLNKPWRPIPAGRLTGAQAKSLALTIYPFALLASTLLVGGTVQCVLLVFFGYSYNDMKGGDVSWLLRNILNACGFTCFVSGALEVALQSSTEPEIIPWLLRIGVVVCTTVHIQDMYDQPGDSAAGRKTVPLGVGDRPSRWSIAIVVGAWSLLCPVYWSSVAVGYVAPVTLGVLVSIRSLAKRTVEEDKTTFRIYNA